MIVIQIGDKLYRQIQRAEWMVVDSGDGLRTICSHCRKETRDEHPFCPKCGSIMGVMDFCEGTGTIQELPQQSP